MAIYREDRFQQPSRNSCFRWKGQILFSVSSGFIVQTFWDLLEEKLKSKGNRIISVIELWTHSKQDSKALNEWLTYVYNLVELCDYCHSKDRIIKDVLIGCNSDKAKDL